MAQYDEGIIRTIIGVGAQMGMTAPQIVSGLATGLVESNLRNLKTAYDHDSLGVFQQRPSMGWGSPSQVTNVQYAAKKYFTELKKTWKDGRSAGANAQAVQRSAYPDRYDKRMGEANRLFRQYANDTGDLSGLQDLATSTNNFDVPILDPNNLREYNAAELLGVRDPQGQQDEVDPEMDELDDVWATAVQVLGDSVRGQFDPNGDLFEEDLGDEFEPLSIAGLLDEQDQVRADIEAGDPVAQLESDFANIGVTPASATLRAGEAQSAAQQQANQQAMQQSRQRAMDMLSALTEFKGKLPAMGPGGAIGPPTSQGIPSGLKPAASRAARVARQLGFDGTIGGIGGRSYTSDHPHGGAIDIMTGLGRQNIAKGWRLANYYHQNRADLDVKYIIFNGKIASAQDNWRWRPYGGLPNGRRDPTAMHDDHVHVSVHY